MAIERTLVLVKPDGVRRRLIGEVIRRLEAKGLTIVAMNMLQMDKEMAAKHYEEHTEKSFFGDLVDFITGGRLLAMAVEGDEAVSVVRTLMGATYPKKAALGTIRGDLAIEMTENIVHGSDSPASAKRELGLFFPDLQ
jgi:nucleoside-diphosphate kinase